MNVLQNKTGLTELHWDLEQEKVRCYLRMQEVHRKNRRIMQNLEKNSKANNNCLELDEGLFCWGNEDDDEVEG